MSSSCPQLLFEVPLEASSHKRDDEAKDGVFSKLCLTGSRLKYLLIWLICMSWKKLMNFKKEELYDNGSLGNLLNWLLGDCVGLVVLAVSSYFIKRGSTLKDLLTWLKCKACKMLKHFLEDQLYYVMKGIEMNHLEHWFYWELCKMVVEVIVNCYNHKRTESSPKVFSKQYEMELQFILNFLYHFYMKENKGNEFLDWVIQEVCKYSLHKVADYLFPKSRGRIGNWLTWVVYKMLVLFGADYLYPTRRENVLLNCLIWGVCTFLVIVGLVADYLYRKSTRLAKEKNRPGPRHIYTRQPDLLDPENGLRNPESHNVLLSKISDISSNSASVGSEVMPQSWPSNTPPPAQEQEPGCTSVVISA